MAFYKICQLGYRFPLKKLVGLCSTPLIVKIYVINHSTFSGYLERGTIISFHPSNHEQYLSNKISQNESAHGVIQNNLIRVLISI